MPDPVHRRLWNAAAIINAGISYSSGSLRVFKTSIVLFFFSVSCTPTTGTRIASNESDLGRIRSIAVTVRRAEEFSVRLSRQEMTATGAVIGSPFGMVGALVGTGIEAATRSSSDRTIEERFQPLISSYDPAETLHTQLTHHLRASKFFESVASNRQDDQEHRSNDREPDARLDITIREWGLRRCIGPRGEAVQIGFSVITQLVTSGGSVIWEREELYMDGACEIWPSYLTTTLPKTLSRAIDNLAGRLVNEMLYP